MEQQKLLLISRTQRVTGDVNQPRPHDSLMQPDLAVSHVEICPSPPNFTPVTIHNG